MFQPTEVLSKIYAAHQEGQKNTGIDLFSGDMMDAVEADIYDLYSGKKSAIKLATDAAITILKIDQVCI